MLYKALKNVEKLDLFHNNEQYSVKYPLNVYIFYLKETISWNACLCGWVQHLWWVLMWLGDSYDKHNRIVLKKKINKLSLNLTIFCAIQNQMSTEAARMYLHLIILRHFKYCLTSWSQAGQSAKNTWGVLNKQQLKLWIKKNLGTIITVQF